MKIGLVCRHYTSTKGGLEKYTLNLSQELVRKGHEVHIFCNTGDEKPGIFLHNIPIFPLSSPGKNLSFALKTSTIIAGFGLDVVQSMERIWSQDIFRASDGINPVQMQQKYPNIFWRKFKAAGLRRQVLSFLERRIFQRGGAEWFLTNSMLIKEQIMRYYQVPNERITVIYNSVDTGQFNFSAKTTFRNAVRDEFGIGRKCRMILFAGNDFQRKGLAVLIKALGKRNDPDTKLLVAGNDSPGHYRRLASRCGIGANVLFIGHYKNPEKLYGSADVFVLPTQYDAFANVCLEAMACGTPVITTRTNGAAEIVEHGKEGFILQTLEVDEVMKRVHDALENADNPLMASNAAQKAAEYTMERHMKSILSLYNKVCEAKTA
jgi:UDP-glucose:(heptosyl)LPS alpha-1,3-glucosyltransferase